MEASSSSRKPIARWDSAGDRILITELLRHIRKGERINNKFGAEVWAQIAAQVNKPSIDIGIRPLSLPQVKNRYFVMKRCWKDFTVLLGTDGFHWDREKGMIDAEKEVWAKYIRAHPKARVFKQKPLENYEDLCEIFGDTGKTTSARNSRGGERAGGQEDGEDDEDEDEDEEAEAEGDEERSSSAEKTLTSLLTYQDSPIPGNSRAQASDENPPTRPLTPRGTRRSWSPPHSSYPRDSASPGSQGNDSYNTAEYDHYRSDYSSPAGRRYNTTHSRYRRNGHPSPAGRRYNTGYSRYSRYNRDDYHSPPVRRCNPGGHGYHRGDRPSPAGRPYNPSGSVYHRNDYSSPADRRHDPRDFNGVADILATGMDRLITTIRSHQEKKVRKKSPKLPTQYVPYAGAVGKAVKLYHNGDISKKNFRLALSFLKHDPLECIAFWFMSDDLCIEWVEERVKESEECADDADDAEA